MVTKGARSKRDDRPHDAPHTQARRRHSAPTPPPPPAAACRRRRPLRDRRATILHHSCTPRSARALLKSPRCAARCLAAHVSRSPGPAHAHGHDTRVCAPCIRGALTPPPHVPSAVPAPAATASRPATATTPSCAWLCAHGRTMVTFFVCVRAERIYEMSPPDRRSPDMSAETTRVTLHTPPPRRPAWLFRRTDTC